MAPTTATPRPSEAHSVQRWISWRPILKPPKSPLMHVSIHVAPSLLMRNSAKQDIPIFAIRAVVV